MHADSSVSSFDLHRRDSRLVYRSHRTSAPVQMEAITNWKREPRSPRVARDAKTGRSGSSLRTQGPIRRGFSFSIPEQRPFFTPEARGDGSLRSQGRLVETSRTEKFRMRFLCANAGAGARSFGVGRATMRSTFIPYSAGRALNRKTCHRQFDSFFDSFLGAPS